MADINGDVDPIRAAARPRSLGRTHHPTMDLLPRANRGIFAINEPSPISPEKIQVGLFNIMQEGDIQIKRLSSPPPARRAPRLHRQSEDYTARSKIIRPLKDRIGAEIRTHYPHYRRRHDHHRQEASGPRDSGKKIEVPLYLRQVVEEMRSRPEKTSAWTAAPGAQSVSPLPQWRPRQQRRAIARPHLAKSPACPRRPMLRRASRHHRQNGARIRRRTQKARTPSPASSFEPPSARLSKHFADVNFQPVISMVSKMGGELKFARTSIPQPTLSSSSQKSRASWITRQTWRPGSQRAGAAAAAAEMILEGCGPIAASAAAKNAASKPTSRANPNNANRASPQTAARARQFN